MEKSIVLELKKTNWQDRQDFNKKLEDRLPVLYLIGKDKYYLNANSNSNSFRLTPLVSGNYSYSTSTSPLILITSLIHIKNYLRFINDYTLIDIYIELYENDFFSMRGTERIAIVNVEGSIKNLPSIKYNKYNKYKIFSLTTKYLLPIPPYDNILHYLGDWILNMEMFL